jgi:hypothetical protein
MKRTVFAAVFFAAFSACTYAGILPTIDTIPSNGDVFGEPGTVVGWGFTLTYSATSDWVVLNDSFFTGTTVYGSYVDYLTVTNAPLYVAGPSPESASITQGWSPSSSPPLGLGEFDLNATDPIGVVITGDIGVDYTIFSEDPNSPSFDPGSFVSSGTLFAPVQIQSTPEPASILLILGALLPFGLAACRRKAVNRRSALL